MKLRPNHEGVTNILIINLVKQEANLQLKRKTEFSHCSLALLPVREEHEVLYLWRTNLSLAKYFKAHSTECVLLTVGRIHKQKKHRFHQK